MTTTESVQTNHEAPQLIPPRKAPNTPPPLHSDDRLTRTEFERRYTAHPEIKKAELVEGVVFVSSPARIRQHGHPHALVVTWLGVYSAATPGAMVVDNGTVRLDITNELQPDAILRLEPEHGGTSRISEDDYTEGPPDLVVEVAASSVANDLNDKLHVYQRNGVREYIVLQVYDRKVEWFILREGIFTPLEPDASGVLRSEVFPGLWLSTETLLADDAAGLLSVLQQGLASEAHTEFVARLQSVIAS